MIPPLFKKSWRGMSGVLDKIPTVPAQHDAFSLAPGSLGTLAGQQYSLLVGDLTPALNLVYSALGHTHAMADIIGLGSAAGSDVTDFAAASHNHVLADVTDAGTAAAANVSDFAAASHNHAASAITSGTLDTARLGSGVASSSSYLRGDQTWQAISAGIGGSTGATDNLLLRADGTGGATLQNSGIRVDDATASTQQNVTIANADSATNSALVLSPKGTGSFILGPKPDGGTGGGNARGNYSVDLQITRSSASQVASGANSFQAGALNTSSAIYGICVGHLNNARAQSNGAYCFGTGNTTGAGSVGSTLVGTRNTSGNYYWPMAFGGFNDVNAQNAVALGFRGTISHSGCVVVGANDDQAVSSDRVKQFKVRADGGMTHQTDGGTMTHWGKRAAAPVTGIAAGDIYYNTATNKHYGYDGAAWNAFW